MTRILIVEDEESLSDPLSYLLGKEGFEVAVVDNGVDAVAEFDRSGADLMLLDLMLPGLSGTEVCRQVRQRSSVPIIMLTAKDAEIDKVVGDEPLTAGHLAALPYVGGIVSESLRLWPPGAFGARYAIEDVPFAGHVIRAGSTVAFFEYRDQPVERYAKPAGVPFPQASQFDHLSLALADEDALHRLQRRLKELP